jgi:signal transduction histidine kinase
MSRVFSPVVRAETYRALLFYVTTLALGGAGVVVVCAGWGVTCLLAITPLVVPLLVGLRASVGGLAAAEAWLARDLLGAGGRPPLLTPAQGFWNRGFATLRDPHFWRQQGHLLASVPIALLALLPFSLGLQTLAVPLYYRAGDVEMFWNSNVNTLPEALVFVPVGLAILLLGIHLLRPLSALSRLLATRLLRDADFVDRRTRAQRRATRMRVLTLDALVSAGVVVLLVAIWALTGGGYFWPFWPMIALALVVGIPGWVLLVLEHPLPRRLAMGSTAFAIQVGVSVVLFGFLVAIWAMTTAGYFWPIWPALGLAIAAAIHAAVLYARRAHRIEALEASRADALDVQESELRRIERDLHDGAQARLVALGMSLGMAEQKLASDDPEAVRELIAEARRGAGEALEELRDLARGIRPPILTDRGLEAALVALTARSPVPVTLSVAVDERPPGAVETALYFVVAEGLANVIKHADARSVRIDVQRSDGALVAEVVDDGRGGANPDGRGLTGLRQRVRALDGKLRISSPKGGPTTLRAEFPCGS